MNAERRTELAAAYRRALLEDTIPFWTRHAPDPEHGGFMTSLGRTGEVIDTDKAVWAQGRFTWLLATLYSTVEPREGWLRLAKSGVEFLERHAFDADGRMFFLLTRDGRPLRKRRYSFSEAFASMAMAAFSRASGDDQRGERAIALFRSFWEHAVDPGRTEPKTSVETRPMRSIGPLMIGMNVAQTLRETIGWPDAEGHIDRCLEEIERLFVKPDLRVVMETVGPSGEILDHFDGRLLNPGHAIEAAWFILHEARHRAGDARLVRLGTSMLDWMWERGWDREHGGLFYFRDVDDHPVQEYWHDMKFWWPHNEAVIATLLASELTGEARFEDMHRLVHDWAHSRFPDREHGEWFGYLHRDGRVSVDLKGNHWKGPFHVPRMQWYCAQLLAESPPNPLGARSPSN